jgi:molybdopterin-containing oxidoreductase family iron-sulfur binding subunit
MRREAYDALLILGGNPAYDAPADLDFAQLLGNVETSVHLSPYVDETSLATTFHVPRAHFLECWGDTRGLDGTYAPQQPLIRPLFNGKSSIEMLAALLGRDVTDGYDLVRETFSQITGKTLQEIDPAFREFLHDGVLDGTATEPVDVGTVTVAEAPVIAAAQGLEVTFCTSGGVYDGRFANNGWMQEAPDAITKLTWDNAALIGSQEAADRGIRTGDVLRLTLGERALEIAAYVLPGQPNGVITLPLGYGRRAGGTLAVRTNDHGGGFDTYQLRTSDGLYHNVGLEVDKVGLRYVLAMTQNHHLIDDTGYKGREKRVGEQGKDGKIIRETSFDKHKKWLTGQDTERKHPTKRKYDYGGLSLQIFQPPSLYNYPHAWGMAIDMTACTGCSACVVACQSENNIPVVGKESVLNNREMHWLRVDRYFKAAGEDVDEKKLDDNPEVVYQPMACVQCENAPCEQVCPVAATVHDTTGLNVMVYNRCIGTRYCSNNCPYKVRRFNYLDYHYKRPRGSTLDATYVGIPDQQQSEIDIVRQMAFNPDVTVRMRGVMEKCTYCSQRIQVQTIYAKNKSATSENAAIEDGDILTACQQACPTEAIVFGNLNDANSRVVKLHSNPRTYGVLDDLNTRPRTKYLAKLRNRQIAKEVFEDEAIDEVGDEVISKSNQKTEGAAV